MVLLSLSFDSLHGILRRLYDEMTELCQPMMTLATAIAALGALFYIAYRVWQSLSRAEPVDVFGMLRPFCLGICILFFDVIVLGSLHGILSPVVQGTGAMLHDQTFDVRKFQEEKDRLLAEMPLKVAVTGEFNPTDEELEKEIADMGWNEEDYAVMQRMSHTCYSFSLQGIVQTIMRKVMGSFSVPPRWWWTRSAPSFSSSSPCWAPSLSRYRSSTVSRTRSSSGWPVISAYISGCPSPTCSG